MSFLKNIFSKGGELISVQIKRGNSISILKAKPGQNLMDLTNKLVNTNSNIYGLCDKQLACTTCTVHIKSHYDLIPQPTDEQIDRWVYEIQHRETRMACQIQIQPELDNILVQIPTLL